MKRRFTLPAALLAAASMGSGCGQARDVPSSSPDHLACEAGTPLAPGNVCCGDGQQRPDCTLSSTHTGYWDLPCPEPLGTTCAAPYTATLDVATAGTLVALYTTGTYHVMAGQVDVTLDGVPAGTSLALLPGGTVNAPVVLGTVPSGTHTIVLRFSSTDGQVPWSWGGFLDLFVKD